MTLAGLQGLQSFIGELRSTTRILATRPGWTMAAFLCLAIGSGAVTSAFSLMNGLLLRPLPFDEPERLVMVALREPGQSGPRPFSLPEYRELAAQSESTATLLARTFLPVSLSADDGAFMAEAELVSGNYFRVLRVNPVLGRFFDESAERPGATPCVVLSHRLWVARFNSDPAVIGRSVRVNGRTADILGVAPEGFVGVTQLIAADAWLPAATPNGFAGAVSNQGTPSFGIVGRLADHVTLDEAEARLSVYAASISRSPSKVGSPSVVLTRASGFGVPVALKGTVLTLSVLIYVLMGLLMLVACANVAALVLARGVGRVPEIAVRLTLGASRWHIARQLVMESLALAVLGCVAGAGLAFALTRALVANLVTSFQYVSYSIDVSPDLRAFGFVAVMMGVATLLCGVAPIRLASRVDVLDALKQTAVRDRSKGAIRMLNGLVILQFGVSTVLLVGTGILIQKYVEAESSELLFDPAPLVAADIDLDQLGADAAQGRRLFSDLLEKIGALPGVEDAALMRESFMRPPGLVRVHADEAPASETRAHSAASMLISDRYFNTLGVPLRTGRSFGSAEPSRPLVAIVNEAMAGRLWPGASPLGRTFRMIDSDERREVIGVSPNVGEAASKDGPQPTFYVPFSQKYSSRMSVLVRRPGEPGALMTEIRRAVREVNSDLSIVDLRSVEQMVDSRGLGRRATAQALAVIAGLALLLSAIGLYGVISYGVRERARELGIRRALGAQSRAIEGLVLRQGLTIAFVGLISGVAAAGAAVQIVRRMSSGVGSVNFQIIGGTVVILLATAVVALYLPAKWAASVEPAHTLRGDW